MIYNEVLSFSLLGKYDYAYLYQYEIQCLILIYCYDMNEIKIEILEHLTDLSK